MLFLYRTTLSWSRPYKQLRLKFFLCGVICLLGVLQPFICRENLDHTDDTKLLMHFFDIVAKSWSHDSCLALIVIVIVEHSWLAKIRKWQKLEIKGTKILGWLVQCPASTGFPERNGLVLDQCYTIFPIMEEEVEEVTQIKKTPHWHWIGFPISQILPNIVLFLLSMSLKT